MTQNTFAIQMINSGISNYEEYQHIYTVLKKIITTKAFYFKKDNSFLIIVCYTQELFNFLINKRRQIEKQLILEKIKIKQVRVELGILDETISSSNKKGCSNCGSFLLSEKSTLCSLCINQKRVKFRNRVVSILSEHPWIQHHELDQSLQKELVLADFLREKKFYITQLYDNIEQYIKEAKYAPKKQTLEMLKQKIEEFVILKRNVSPENLTMETIESTIHPQWYNYYCQKVLR